jgi:deazaflavin-dependent oxidoreductase (nitroreductase family)
MESYSRARLFHRLMRRTVGIRPIAWLYIRIQAPLDRYVYRLTRGRTTVSSLSGAVEVAMLTTTGAKSGEPRTQPVLAVLDGNDLIVIASNYGRPRHPAWYHNLRALPSASVELDGRKWEVEAEELEGEERERCWERGIEFSPAFDQYRRWAGSRQIPVIRLVPVESSYDPVTSRAKASKASR